MSTLATPTSSSSAVRKDAAWLEAHWMPFTGNRNFKNDPRMIVSAQGAYFTDIDGRNVQFDLPMIFMDGGHIVEQGPAAAFFANPQQARTRAFLQNML